MNKETKKSILIIANGKSPKSQLLQKLVTESDCIIAADGGANVCFKNNIYPDYVIGDFDSVDEELKNHFKDSEFIYRPQQDKHDLLKALEYCKVLNPEKVIVTAVFGKRVDHMFSNLFILQNQEFSFPVEYFDDYGKVLVIKRSFEMKLRQKHPVSFLSFSPIFGITLSGFKYNVTDKDYPNGFNGVSNQTDKNPASVKIKQGSLIAIIPHV